MRRLVETAFLTALQTDEAALWVAYTGLQFVLTRDVSVVRMANRIEVQAVGIEDLAWAIGCRHQRATVELRAVTAQAADSSGAICEALANILYKCATLSAFRTYVGTRLQAATQTLIANSWRVRALDSPNQAGPSAANPAEHVAAVQVECVFTYDPT